MSSCFIYFLYSSHKIFAKDRLVLWLRMQWEWKCNDCHYGHCRLCKWPKHNCHSSVYVSATESPSTSFTRGLAEGQGGCLHRATSQRTFLQQQSRNTVNKTNKVNQSRRQIIKMLLVIILVFTACWCPRLYNNIYNTFAAKIQIFSPNSIKYFLCTGSWLTWSSGWRRPWAGSSMPPNLSITSHALQSFFPSYTPCSILLSTGN